MKLCLPDRLVDGIKRVDILAEKTEVHLFHILGSEKLSLQVNPEKSLKSGIVVREVHPNGVPSSVFKDTHEITQIV